MTGILSPLISLTYNEIKSLSIPPFIYLPLMVLVFKERKITFLKSITYWTNSGLSSSSCILSSFCKEFSSVSGRTKVKQLLLLNDYFMDIRILFLTYESPGCGLRQFYKYYLVDSDLPSLSTNASEKSLSIQ